MILGFRCLKNSFSQVGGIGRFVRWMFAKNFICQYNGPTIVSMAVHDDVQQKNFVEHLLLVVV